MSRQAKIKLEDIPENWSPEAADFINKVLQYFYIIATST
jgi:hypothetical protein